MHADFVGGGYSWGLLVAVISYVAKALTHFRSSCDFFVFDWKLSQTTRLQRLILLAHWTTKLPFSLAQE